MVVMVVVAAITPCKINNNNRNSVMELRIHPRYAAAVASTAAASKRKKPLFVLPPHQVFLQNFLSVESPYHSLLLFHDLELPAKCALVTKMVGEVQHYRKRMAEVQLTTAAGLRKVYVVGKDRLRKRMQQRMQQRTNVDDDSPPQMAFFSYNRFRLKIKECLEAQTLASTFSETLIIVDDVHLLTTQPALALALAQLCADNTVEGTSFLLLTPSPMYEQPQEIVSLLNWLSTNDGFSPIDVDAIFAEDGKLLEGGATEGGATEGGATEGGATEGGGEDLLRQVASHYISYVPAGKATSKPGGGRLYPADFLAATDWKEAEKYLKGAKLEKLALYVVPLTTLQSANVKQAAQEEALQALNIAYPNGQTGFKGLRHFMRISKKKEEQSGPTYAYLPDQERLFEPANLGQYSAKIKRLCECINVADTTEGGAQDNVKGGVVVVFSQWLDSGLIPVALALEHLGYDRVTMASNDDHDQKKVNNNLYKTALTPHNKKLYQFVTNDKALSPTTILAPHVSVFLVSIKAADRYDLEFRKVRQIHILDPGPNLRKTEALIQSGCSKAAAAKAAVQIYLHCAVHTFHDADMTADVRLYQSALENAQKIGVVTRLLKEMAIDCHVRNPSLSLTASAIKPGSALCDYMDECAYTCRTTLKPAVLTIDSILKTLFREKYFYSRDELLVAVISALKTKVVPADVWSTTKALVENKTPVMDKLKRVGSIVQIGDLLIWQPGGA
jgi:hypothetical protein